MASAVDLSLTNTMAMPVFSYEPKDTASQRWVRWLARFDNYLEAAAIEKPERKKAMLLHLIGEELYGIYDTLTVADLGTGETVYDCAKKALSNFFLPKRNIEFELFKFRQAEQQPGEDLDTFYTNLKQLAINCEFTNTDAEIKSQIIQKCVSTKLREEGMSKPNLSLVDLLRFGRTLESSKRHAKVMEEKLSKPAQVNKLSKPKQSVSSKSKQNQKGQESFSPGKKSTKFTPRKPAKTCYNCGGNWPHPKGKRCPAYGKKCSKCGKQNHFAAVCAQKSVHAVFDDGNESEDEYEAMFNVTSFGPNSHSAYHVILNINGVDTEMEIDTGASISIVNKMVFDKITGTDPTTSLLRRSQAKLKTYTGDVIIPEGETTVCVCYENQCKELDLTVVSGDGPSLMGRNWLQEIKLKWDNILHVNQHDENQKSPLAETEATDLEEILNRYDDIFKEELGLLKGTTVTIHIEKDAHPQFYKPRQVPFSMKDKVLKELTRLADQGIIKPVQFSDWATPIVPVLKPSGDVRLCGDYRITINQVAKSDTYPLPLVDDLFTKLSGGLKYTKLDLSNAYLQLPLDQESQRLTTINTPKGLFSYTRLPFGISAAPSIFQRTLESILQGIPNAAVYLDDILITGPTQKEHVKNLNQVLEKLEGSGLRLKREKCSFFQDSVSYLGHVIDKDGIHPDPKKLQGIVDAPEPQNISELRSYLGMINYYNKFIKNASTLLKPLYDLLHLNTKWVWNKKQKEAFTQSKELLTSNKLLVHFNPKLKLILECDASAFGLGVVLSHEMENKECKPIAFASRTLADAEKSYSQLEKEALSITFGIKRFHKYLYGRRFIIVTDHKPLLGLLNQTKQIPTMASARIQRWSLLLGGYEYELRYRKGKDHSNADALSRLPSSDKPAAIPTPTDIVLSINFINDTPINYKDIARESSKDPLISRVMNYVLNGWPKKSKEEELQVYFCRRLELTVQSGCLLWGSRIVIPPKFREPMLAELHATHPGIVRMKGLSRSYIWWPQLNQEIVSTVRQCSLCQEISNDPPKAPLHPWNWPHSPWDRLHIDYAGPLEGKMLLVIVDAGTKFLTAHVMTRSTSTATIDKLRETFAAHGIPRTIVSDNGTPFVSREFEQFCQLNGINHITCSPYHPASNGQAERAVQTIKNGLRKTGQDSLEARLFHFLLTYNITPHSTTGEAPSVLLMKRRLRTRLDLVRPDLEAKVETKQGQMKDRHDSKSKDRQFFIGDSVYARNFLGKPKWLAGVIEENRGPVTFVVRLTDGRLFRRHQDHLKARFDTEDSDNEDDPDKSKPTGNILDPSSYQSLDYDKVTGDKSVISDTGNISSGDSVSVSPSVPGSPKQSFDIMDKPIKSQTPPSVPSSQATPVRRSIRPRKAPKRLICGD